MMRYQENDNISVRELILNLHYEIVKSSLSKFHRAICLNLIDEVNKSLNENQYITDDELVRIALKINQIEMIKKCKD